MLLLQTLRIKPVTEMKTVLLNIAHTISVHQRLQIADIHYKKITTKYYLF